MRYRIGFALALACLLAAGSSVSFAQEKPQIQVPQSGVPQIMTIEGNFIRIAYNNEGYAIIGYKLANNSIGEEWMLLEFGTTVLDKTPNYKLKREASRSRPPTARPFPCRRSRSIARATRARCSSARRSCATRSTTSR